jgi:hypothetical protein
VRGCGCVPERQREGKTMLSHVTGQKRKKSRMTELRGKEHSRPASNTSRRHSGYLCVFERVLTGAVSVQTCCL